MENDPKEEIHDKSLLAEARRNLEDIARAEAEEAAEAERERSKSPDVEETSGSGGNSVDINTMQAAETGAGASVLPLPLSSTRQNVQKTTKLNDDSTTSERSHRSVSDASNKVLEPSNFSMTSRDSHKDHTNITSNAPQGVGHVVAEKGKENTPSAPNVVGAADDISETENHGFSHGVHTVNKLTVPSSAESPNVKQETNALTIPPPPNPYMEVGTGRVLTSSTIADLINEEQSQDGAVAAVVEVMLGNSEPMTPTLLDTAPPPYEPIPATKKKSFIKRLFSKKSRACNTVTTQREQSNGSMVENSANGLKKEKALIEDIVKYMEEIHLVEEDETAKCATDCEEGNAIGAEASRIEIVRPQKDTTPNVLNPAIAATLDSTPATQVTGIDADDIAEANRRIQEADKMVELYNRIQEAGGVIEIENGIQNILTNETNNRLEESGGVQMMQMLATANNVENNVLQEPEVSDDDDSCLQRYPGVADLSAILQREGINVRNSKPEETGGLSEDSSGIQEVAKLTKEKSRIHGFVEVSKVNSPQDTTEISEVDKVPDVSEITPIPSAPSISEFSNRRFDTSEFSLQTSDSLKGQDERSSEVGVLKVEQIRLESSKEAEVENAGGQRRQGLVDNQVIRSEPSSIGPMNNTEPQTKLSTSAIAALIVDESSERGAVAMAAVLEVTSQNTLRLTTVANQPPPYEINAMPPTRKKSLLKRIFSKKARTKLKNDKNKSPERQN